jgi:hypothetical protein
MADQRKVTLAPLPAVHSGCTDRAPGYESFLPDLGEPEVLQWKFHIIFKLKRHPSGYKEGAYVSWLQSKM